MIYTRMPQGLPQSMGGPMGGPMGQLLDRCHMNGKIEAYMSVDCLVIDTLPWN